MVRFRESYCFQKRGFVNTSDKRKREVHPTRNIGELYGDFPKQGYSPGFCDNQHKKDFINSDS